MKQSAASTIAMSIRWTLATVVAVVLACQTFVGLALVGFAAGLGQWYAAHRVGLSAWWIPATGIGWLAGVAAPTPTGS